MKKLLLLCLAAFLVPTTVVSAQTVRGDVVESGGGAPVAGARVLLLDGAGHRVAAAVTGPDGAYQLTAPSAGSYLLRVERIGFAATSMRVELGAGETVQRRVASGSAPIRLTGITARGGGGASRCQVRPDSGQMTATLWEEARKALDLADNTQAEELYRYRIRTMVRDLTGPELRQVRAEQVADTAGSSVQPFFSAPLRQLQANGFIQTSGENEDSVQYYAPDAEVLLSGAFLDTHCFRVADHPDSAGLVGLAFEPVRGRRTTDVKGVLWLDRATSELRWLDYGYTNAPLPGPDGVPGGRIDFRRLPNASWIVSRWQVRMPFEEIHPIRNPADPTPPPTLTVREKVGEVVDVLTRLGQRVDMNPPQYATLEGVVYDSTRRAPLAGARVFLSGTPHEAVTDSAGRFVLAELREGTYTLSFAAPRLDTLGYVPLPQQVTLAARAVERRELGVPAGAGAVAMSGSIEVTDTTTGAGILAAMRSRRAAVPVRGVRGVSAPHRQTLEDVGFYSRRQRGGGVFLTDSMFNRNTPLESVLRSITGVRVVRILASSSLNPRMGAVAGNRTETRVVSSRSGVTPGLSLSSSGSTENTLKWCYIPVYVDGRQVLRGDEGEGNDLTSISLEHVVAIEVYRGGPDTPAEFGGVINRCGVILLWTEDGPRGTRNSSSQE
jgi:carboxypeptidase family protein